MLLAVDVPHSQPTVPTLRQRRRSGTSPGDHLADRKFAHPARLARSGDKGNTSNIGVIARRPEWLPLLQVQLTPQRRGPSGWAHLGMAGDASRGCRAFMP